MKTIHVEGLSDSHDCETCGSDFASGYVISVDGAIVVDKTPFAACYDGTNYEANGYWMEILELLKKHFTADFPAELSPEKAIGEEPDYDKDNPEQWNMWSDRHNDYPNVLKNFMQQKGLVFTIEFSKFELDVWDDADGEDAQL